MLDMVLLGALWVRLNSAFNKLGMYFSSMKDKG